MYSAKVYGARFKVLAPVNVRANCTSVPLLGKQCTIFTSIKSPTALSPSISVLKVPICQCCASATLFADRASPAACEPWSSCYVVLSCLRCR